MQSIFILLISISITTTYVIYVQSVAASSTAASTANTLELKSYSCNTMEMKSKLDSGDFLKSTGTDGESKSFGVEASVVEIDNEKPPITGTYI